MSHNPESLLVLGALDDEDELIAFVIAQNPGFNTHYIYVAQVWSHKQNPFSVAEELHAQVVLWAMSLGKSYLSGETQRSTAAIFHKFGFEPVAQVMRFDIDESVRERTLDTVKESLHVKRV